MLFDGAPVPVKRRNTARSLAARPWPSFQTPGRGALRAIGTRMTRLNSNEVLTGAGMALAGLALGSVLLRARACRRWRGRETARLRSGGLAGPKTSATVRAARRLNRAAGTLAASVLADSGVEHYRGSFKNKAMFTPLIVSALTLATSIHGTSDMRPVAHRVRDTTYLLAAATGLIGTGFHIYNVGKKVGGFSWQNFFYAAPLGAPMAILLVGPRRILLGAGARERAGSATRDIRPAGGPHDGGGRWGRPAGHDRRSRSAALPWRISQPIHGASGDVAAARRRHARVGRSWRARPRAPLHALVDAAAGRDGFCRRRISMPTACPATWAAGATGARTSSTGRRFRRRRALRGSRSPVSPRSA